jgi:hypothetical protein
MGAPLHRLCQLKETVVVILQNSFFYAGAGIAFVGLKRRIILRVAGNGKPPPGLVAGTTLLRGAGVRTAFSLELEFFDNRSLV